MQYIRSNILETGIVADPNVIDMELQRAASVLNGSIEGLQIDENTVGATKLQAESCNKFYIENSPFGVGTITFDKTQIVSRDWTFPEDLVINWNAPEDGVVVGSFEHTIRYYGQSVSDQNFGWSIGIFIDGALAGRTEKCLTQFMCGGLPFHAVVTKGDHEIRLGILTYAYSASDATDPDDVISVYSSQLWWQLRIR